MFIKLIKILLYIGFVGFTLFVILFKPVNNQPYQQQPYYAKTLANLDSMASQPKTPKGDTVRAGWSRQSITPEEPVKLMGYGLKGDYERIHDSLYVRVVVFSDGYQKIAFVSYDLMMVHPAVVEAVEQSMDSLMVNHIYFTAVHTHNGYGEWATGLAGKVIAGGYNKDLVYMIASKTKLALMEAIGTQEPVAIGYSEYPLPALLGNRLVKGGPTDSLLRVVALRKKNGETGIICTFAAHATYITSKSKDLSADYPGALIEQLEADTTISFAVFAAGAVGSHSPAKQPDFSYEALDHYAAQLARPFLLEKDDMTFQFTNRLLFLSLPIVLGEPQLKISERWCVRPWLFNAFFREIDPAITLLQIGTVAFVGYPGDFSGMLYPNINKPDGLHVVVTSFNGNYIGYIIPDILYNHNDPEAREMNWFGPNTGSYFIDLTNRLLDL